MAILAPARAMSAEADESLTASAPRPARGRIFAMAKWGLSGGPPGWPCATASPLSRRWSDPMPRPRKPTELLQLTGAYRPDRHGPRLAAPKSGRPIGDPPVHLAPDEAAAWREHVRDAAPGVLTGYDRCALEDGLLGGQGQARRPHRGRVGHPARLPGRARGLEAAEARQEAEQHRERAARAEGERDGLHEALRRADAATAEVRQRVEAAAARLREREERLERAQAVAREARERLEAVERDLTARMAGGRLTRAWRAFRRP